MIITAPIFENKTLFPIEIEYFQAQQLYINGCLTEHLDVIIQIPIYSILLMPTQHSSLPFNPHTYVQWCCNFTAKYASILFYTLLSRP